MIGGRMERSQEWRDAGTGMQGAAYKRRGAWHACSALARSHATTRPKYEESLVVAWRREAWTGIGHGLDVCARFIFSCERAPKPWPLTRLSATVSFSISMHSCWQGRTIMSAPIKPIFHVTGADMTRRQAFPNGFSILLFYNVIPFGKGSWRDREENWKGNIKRKWKIAISFFILAHSIFHYSLSLSSSLLSSLFSPNPVSILSSFIWIIICEHRKWMKIMRQEMICPEDEKSPFPYSISYLLALFSSGPTRSGARTLFGTFLGTSLPWNEETHKKREVPRGHERAKGCAQTCHEEEQAFNLLFPFTFLLLLASPLSFHHFPIACQRQE